MRNHLWPAMLVMTTLLWPAPIYAQTMEAQDTETLRPQTKGQTSTQRPDLNQAAKMIIQRTNDFRRDEGRLPVEVNTKLMETAQDFADYMARTDTYGHTADGTRPSDRVKQHGYDHCIIAENIAYHYNSAGFTSEKPARGCFEGWKQSPHHRENMLDPDITDTGVAIARSEETGYYYAVQLFGRPKSKAIEFTIANQSDGTVQYQIGDRTFPLPPLLIRTHQRCRPTEITFRWPGDQGDARIVHPRNGDRVVIQSQNGHYRLTKE